MLHIKKHRQTLKTNALIFILGLSLLLGSSASAAIDDPGRGRLSGECISGDFYSAPPVSPFARFGLGETANPYTGQTYTHQPRFNSRMVLNGIDVSFYQGNDIDWNKVKAAGIDYAFIRVGFRGYGTAGTLNESTKDTCYEVNMQKATAAGVKVGIYIFSQAITTSEAVEEANYILNHIGSYDVTMPLIMDYEYATSNGGRLYNAKLSKAKATEICLAFCETIAESGYTPMIYANKSMLESQLNAAEITSSGYRTWLANYTTNTAYSGDFDFWQYSSSGAVSGITGNVDMNFYYVKPGDNFTKDKNPFMLSTISEIPDQLYTGAKITPEITVTNNSRILAPGVDYTVTYSNNIEVGTASITITGMGEFAGTKTFHFKIVPADLTTATVSAVPNQAYTGSSLTPEVTVSCNGAVLIKDKDYTLSYTNNKTVGTASLTVTGIGEYSGKVTVPFTIVPADTSGLKAKKKSSQYITLSWNKNSSGTGYQIYRAFAADGTYKKIKTINSYKTVSYKNTNLNAGQCYYYKIRSYKKVGSTTYYGAFSAVKNICTSIGYTRNANIKKNTVLYGTASPEGTQLAQLAAGTILPVSYYTKDKDGSGWYSVSYKTEEKTYQGFVPDGTVTITKVGKITNAGKVNVRKSNSTSSKVLTTLKKNKKVTVLSSKKKKGVTWYKVTFKKNKKNYTGWISAPYLKII